LAGQPHLTARMFAKRKERQREEEPFVPHGLVWQATGDEATLERDGQADAGARNRISGLALPSAQASFPNQASSPNNEARVLESQKKPASSSPPPFWRSQPKPEIVRQVAAPRHTPDVAVAPPRVDRQPTILKLVLQKRMLAGRLAAISRTFSKRWTLIGNTAANSLLIARASLWHWINAGGKFGPRFRAVCLSKLAAGKSRGKQQFASLKAAVLRTKSEVSRLSLPDAYLSDRAFKVRVRLAGLPLRARISFTRATSEWRLKNSAPGDSRAWTSIVMGACCALIALGLVSAGRRYGDASLPSRTLHPGAVPSVVTPVVAESQEKPAKLSVKRRDPTRKSNPSVTKTRRTTAQPKPRRQDDDDYVARDTYVYYGDNPPRSH
jgi:hypothetical protein